MADKPETEPHGSRELLPLSTAGSADAPILYSRMHRPSAI